jgi:hypothetical protein
VPRGAATIIGAAARRSSATRRPSVRSPTADGRGRVGGYGRSERFRDWSGTSAASMRPTNAKRCLRALRRSGGRPRSWHRATSAGHSNGARRDRISRNGYSMCAEVRRQSWPDSWTPLTPDRGPIPGAARQSRGAAVISVASRVVGVSSVRGVIPRVRTAECCRRHRRGPLLGFPICRPVEQATAFYNDPRMSPARESDARGSVRSGYAPTRLTHPISASGAGRTAVVTVTRVAPAAGDGRDRGRTWVTRARTNTGLRGPSQGRTWVLYGSRGGSPKAAGWRFDATQLFLGRLPGHATRLDTASRNVLAFSPARS